MQQCPLSAQVGRDGEHVWKQSGQKGKWRRKCLYSDGWIDTWSVPNLALTIEFFFHPIPVPGPAPQADVATPDKEDDLLSPLRMSSLPERTGVDSEMGSGSSVRGGACGSGGSSAGDSASSSASNVRSAVQDAAPEAAPAAL